MVTPTPAGRRTAPIAGGAVLHAHAYLVRVARGRGPDATAEDRVQDVWLDVLAKGVPEDVAATPDRLRAWLCGVLDHKFQDATRREGRATACPPDPDEPAADGGDPAAELIRLETAAAVRRTVASIAGGRGRECVRCLELRYLDGLSLAEVATATGCTVRQVAARLQRAKRRFRRAWVGVV